MNEPRQPLAEGDRAVFLDKDGTLIDDVPYNVDPALIRLAPGAALPADHPAAGKGLVDGRPALYVCRDMACRPPVTDAASFDL